ncbi:GDSL-type esterase/lipase family protein [Candidatus Halobeggiatoa sp. HSG11]|nr:GDSL-type esterase/lipase family protein [Candidatus Halobeggiatoa sp. HSG11]
MKKLYILIVVLLISCSSDVPILSPLSNDAIILAFGDSLTYGVGASSDTNYPAVLSKLIQREIINAGIPGERTAQGLERLPELLEEYNPNLLILCHGGNDMLQKTGEKQAADNIISMIQIAQEYGTEVVLIGVPKPRLFLPSAPDFYAEIATKMNIPYDGKIMAYVLSKKAFKSDIVHPNVKGYQKIATAIAELLKQAKAIQ